MVSRAVSEVHRRAAAEVLRVRVEAAHQSARKVIAEAEAAQARRAVVGREMAASQRRIERSWQSFLGGLSGGSRRNVLGRSEYARLTARLQSMPVIEQAKGILMVQRQCSQDEAFDLLRRASQRANVPVRELAARIVSNCAQR